MNKLFLEHSATALAGKIREGSTKASDLVAASLENIREMDPKYFPWVTYADEALLERVRLADASIASADGSLAGIPVGIKDIYNTADFPTQMGSPLWKGFTPGNDARAVFNLKRQGTITVGKTVTAEFAVHALEKTLNPYDVVKTPGTSSTGSAVSITLGMVPLAVGTQTAGSIIRPASFCGIYGCKPSFGLIPRTGMLKTTDSLDTLGFFAIHQEDLRVMFDAMRVSGKDYPISNSALSDAARQAKSEGRPWRIGIARTHTWANTPAYAKEALEGFIKTLSAQDSVEIFDAPLPESMQQAHETHATIYNKSLSYYFATEYSQAEFVSPVMNKLIADGREISPEAFKKALGLQVGMIRDMDAYFKDFDVLISLSTAGEAPNRDIEELPDPSLMWTLSHLPAVSVPQFASPSGLPFGFQIVARKYNDYLLFGFLDHLAASGIVPTKAAWALGQ